MINLLKKGFLLRVESQLSKDKNSIAEIYGDIDKFVKKYPEEKTSILSKLKDKGVFDEYNKLLEYSNNKNNIKLN